MHCQTGVQIVRKASLKPNSEPKSNKVENEFKHQPIENTTGSIVIQTNKINKKRKKLPFKMVVMALYSCGLSLKSVAVDIDEDPYVIRRISRFPVSIFEIDESSDKERRFRLQSNFVGSKYNLFEDKELLLTIVFEATLCANFSFRSFSIFYLASGVSSQTLFKKQENEDLQTMFQYPENCDKIRKMISQSPKMGAEGEFTLNFERNHVQPAVENALVIDASGDLCIQMVKLGDNQFEVGWRFETRREWALAFALASLDFKWAIQ